MHFLTHDLEGLIPFVTEERDEKDKTNTELVIGKVKMERFRLLQIDCGLIQFNPRKFKEVTFVEAAGDKPEYNFVNVVNIPVHFRDGARPYEDGTMIGRIEVEVRRVITTREGGVENAYLAIDILPCANGNAPTTELRLWSGPRERPPEFAWDKWYGPASKGGSIFLIDLTVPTPEATLVYESPAIPAPAPQRSPRQPPPGWRDPNRGTGSSTSPRRKLTTPRW